MIVNMPKELWESIAKDFGLELGEEFHLKEAQNISYRFTDKGLEDSMNGVWGETSSVILNGVLHGRLTIVRIPWKPKDKDRYYFLGLGSSPRVMNDTWEGYPVDFNRYKNYNCFKTCEEAEAKLKKILNVLKND